MGKIGDLFVRLGLKSDGFKRGMDDARKETRNFGQSLGKMKAGALAVWAAIGAGVTTFVKDFIAGTNKVGDAWAVTMSSMKASYHSVIADMSNYKPDTSSLRAFFKGEWEWIRKTFGNAQDAGQAAAEMTRAFDAEFELVNSVRLQRQAITQELNELYIRMRDTTLDAADRKAAGERYKALLQPIADAEVAVYGNMLKKAVAAWQAGNELDREYSVEELTEFFSRIGTEYEKMQQKFPDLMRVYETRKGDAQNQIIFDTISKLQQAANQMSEIDRILSRSMNAIKGKLGFEGYKGDPSHGIYMELGRQMANDYRNMNESFDMEALDEIDMADVENDMAAFLSAWQSEVDQIVGLNQMLEDSFVSAFSNGMQAFTDMLFNIEGADASQIMAAVLQPIAQTSTQLGEMLIAEGVAISAFKESLKSLNPYVAIAAGVALVAVGAALTSGIKALGNSGGGMTAATTGAAGASTPSGLETYESEITVKVVGEISGDSIVLAGERTLNKWNR